jgi:lipoyl(octanoyl) transferase
VFERAAKPSDDAMRGVDEASVTARSGPLGDARRTASVEVTWLGRQAYRPVWELQKRLAAARADGAIVDQLLLVEHDPVLTLGRHADEIHVRATTQELEARGIDLIRVERGGEVTYHGPGQLVAYPILALAPRGLLLRPLVRSLEAAMVATCERLGVDASRREGHPGCWIDPEGPRPRKIGALGIRVERGVTYHGIALNIAPELDDFDLIDPCGMPDVVSTSIARERALFGAPASALGGTAGVEEAAAIFAASFIAAIGATLEPGHAAVDSVDAPLIGAR